ncbi:uncharacterized protein TNCV_2257671 [Trichonephila clavipes]|nr:uncharacterized protein TNCV_2257671 [Trichonephila clavipes]
MAALVSEYTLEYFTLLNARGKKELIEWCMKEGLIASSYECPKCNEQMGLNERKSVVLDGFEWRCRKKDRIKMGRTILLERRQTKSVRRRDDCPAYCDLIGRGQSLRRKWRGIGLGRSENKRPETRRS